MRRAARHARRIGVAALGGAIVLVGLAMVVLPGPGLVLVPAGLGVLALEFDAARRLRDRLLGALRSGRERWQARRAGR